MCHVITESEICKEVFEAMEKEKWLPLCERVKETEHRYSICEVIDSIIKNLGGGMDGWMDG
jgi:hypothetical protein